MTINKTVKLAEPLAIQWRRGSFVSLVHLAEYSDGITFCGKDIPWSRDVEKYELEANQCTCAVCAKYVWGETSGE